MKAIDALWQKAQTRYGALTRREQGLVAAALLLGPLLIGKALFIDPQIAKTRALEKSILAQKRTQSELQSQVSVLQVQLANDPDTAAKAELAALRDEQAALEKEVLGHSANLVLPQEMNGLLERLLHRQPGLRLLSLKTLAPSSVLPAPPAPETAQGDAAPVIKPRAFDLFRHGVEIRVEGRYEELQAYLAQLEQLQQRLLWGKLQ